MKQKEIRYKESIKAEAFAEHERQQILHTVHNSTPLDRLNWLEQMKSILGPILIQARTRSQEGVKN